jgi:D-alanyl-D-alanine carboxypeptidase
MKDYLRNKCLFAVSFLVILLINFPAYSACIKDLDKNIQKIIDQGRVKYQLLGMQVSVLCKDEKIPHDFVTGDITINHLSPITANSLFQIGSITKSFTAALILKLETDGLLSLNDKIGLWLPQLPKKWKKITIKQLLNHTSGLPDYSETDDFRKAELLSKGQRQWRQNELWQFVEKLSLKFPPGKGYDYSNTNYLLAGMIIDIAVAAQEKTYADLIKTQLFEPIGLMNTYYLPYPYPAKIFEQMAHGYRYLDENSPQITDITSFNMSYANSAGANVSTAHDVTIWLQNLMHGNVLTADQLNKMMSMVDETTGQPTQLNGYGLGIYQQSIGNEEIWRHNGKTIAYHAGMVWLKCRDIFLAYTNNKGPVDGPVDDFGESQVLTEIISFIQQADPKKVCQLPESARLSASSAQRNDG